MKPRWILHPLVIFILSTAAVVTSLFLYIYWYMRVTTNLDAILIRFNVDRNEVLASRVWVVILILSVLMAVMFTGTFIIFLYHQKLSKLYALQQNFIHTFTHELKTPVTSLKLYLDTALKYRLYTEEQRKYIDYMVQDVSRLSGTINRMLMIAKLESGHFQEHFEYVDLAEFIQSFLKTHSDLTRKGVVMFHPTESGPFRCRINETLFEVVLSNLITNAFRYNQSETPRVDIYLERESDSIIIRIVDNGIGIPSSEVDKIFRKFYKIEKPGQNNTTGSGLGLYLVKSIARAHKARVFATSPGLGKGSEFVFMLPCTGEFHAAQSHPSYPDRRG